MGENILRIVSFCLLIALSHANETGAPETVCNTMIPAHGVDPQTTVSPYSLTVDKTQIKAGQNVTVTISTTKQDDVFIGFLLQARNASNRAVGTFYEVADTKTINCGNGKKNALTHNSKKDKKKIVVKWNAPSNTKGPITFRLTVAKTGEVFWVGQQSSTVTVA